MTRAILVTDGEQRAALAVVRALGRAGFVVHVAAARPRSLAGGSRSVTREWRVPDPLSSPDGFVSEVRRIIEQTGSTALIPVTEAALLALLPESFPGVLVPFPDLETFRRISDKALVMEAGRKVGIATPAQHVLARAEDCTRLPLRYPLVVKPARSVAEVGERRVKAGVQYATTPEALQAALRTIDPALYPVLLQERIEGPGVGVFLLLWEKRVLAAFSHRRIREKPPSGGVSVYRESIALDPDLVERSRRLLEAFDWRGVAMIEYKLDAATGTPYLMEINGRFWGSLQLAIDAGVNFPLLLLEAAEGRNPDPVTTYRNGVRSRWWWGDVDQLVARLRHSAAELELPPGAKGKLAALVEFLALWRPGDRNEVLRVRDPVPFLRESLDWLLRR